MPLSTRRVNGKKYSVLRGYLPSMARDKSNMRSFAFESLEVRLALSGETIAPSIGTLPNGEGVSVQFDALVDAPFPKGDSLVQNQAIVSGASITGTISAAINTPIDRAPEVTGVFIKSSAWSPLFLNHLSATGVGDSSLGYRIATGADQLTSVPWVGIDSFSVTFSENVNVGPAALQLSSVAPISAGAPTVNAGVATWAFGAPLAVNKLRVVLNSAAVTDTGNHQQLDGEWLDSTAAMPSGDGVAGGDFSFRINVLPGDGNRDGTVNITDAVNMSSRATAGAMITVPGTSVANYTVYYDVNGDGAVSQADVTATMARLRSVLPVSEPGGVSGTGWITNATPTPPRGAAVAGTLNVSKSVVLFNDIDGDGAADAGDTLRYLASIVNASGSSVSSVSLVDVIDANTTLVGGSLKISPVAIDDAYATPINTTLAVANVANGVTNNDALGTPIATVTSFGAGSLGGSVVDHAAGSTVTFGSTGSLTVNSNGTFNFTPNTGFTGLFTFQYRDGNTVGSDEATVSITVTQPNTPPTGVPDSASVTEDTTPVATGNVLTNDTDPNPGTTLTVSQVNGSLANVGIAVAGTYGSLTLGSNGGYTYSLNSATNIVQALTAGQAVSDVFSYTPNDGTADGSSTTLTINITGTNDAPVLANIEGTSLAYNQNASAIAITSSLTVSDVDTANVTSATVAITSGYVNGQDTLSFANQLGITGTFAAATGILTLTGTTSKANYETALRAVKFQNVNGATNTATRTISFQVDDGQAANHASNVVTRNISINRLPTVVADTYNAIGNTELLVGIAAGSTPAVVVSGSVFSNDSDADGNTPLSINSSSAAGIAGTLTLNSNGTFRFLPNVGFVGNTSFTYRAADSQGLVSATAATVTISVSETVWYVDDSAAVGGTGQSNSPLQSLAPLNTGGALDATDNADDYIFVYSGNYSGGLVMETGQRLVGQAAGLTVGGLSIAASGTRPALAHNTGSTVALSTNNEIRGMSLTNSNGSGITGTSIGTLALADFDVTLTSGNTAHSALSVSTSGTITATGTNNTLSAPSGTALSVSSVTIGAAGMTFNRVSAGNNTAAADPAIGILLNNTGSGALTITGDGAAASNSTGGTIQNVTDTGIKLTNASNVSLARMRITNSGNFGLKGDTVNVLNIDRTIFDGNHGDVIDEGALYVTNWLGSGTISNSDISGGANDTVRVTNTTGSLNRLTISGTTIHDHSPTSVVANHGLRFNTNLASGTGAGVVMNLTVTGGSVFRNNRQNHIDTGATGLSSMDIVIDHTTFSTTNFALGGAVNITDDHQADVTFDVNTNNSQGSRLSAFNFFINNQTTAAASVIGTFRDNVIGTSGVADSGSRQGDGVDFTATGLAKMTVSVTGNQIRRFQTTGIALSAGDTSPTVNATVTGNVVKEGHTVNSLNGISANIGTTAAGAVNAYLDIGGAGALKNDVAGAVPSSGSGEIRVRQRNSSTVRLPGYGGGSSDTAAVISYLTGRNTTAGFLTATASGAGGGFVNGAPFPLAAVSASRIGATEPQRLTYDELHFITAAAIDRFAAAGTTAEQLERLRAIDFGIVDFAGTQLGSSWGDTIVIDADGAGYGYFVDPSPLDDLEFETVRHRGRRGAIDDSAARDRIDLLSVVMHEMGHVLGLKHSRWGAMNERLAPGVRQAAIDAVFTSGGFRTERFLP